MFKVIKSDRRYNGYEQFKYVVSFLRSDVVEYNVIRDWCRVTWGAGCELGDWSVLNHRHKEYPVNQHWCWQTEHGLRRIYLRTEKEANWFKLKYGI